MTIKVKMLTKRYDEYISSLQQDINEFFKENDGITKDHLIDIKMGKSDVMIIWDDFEVEEDYEKEDLK